MRKNIMNEEAFNELIDGFEYIGNLTDYGRENIKYHVQKLQQENKQLKDNWNYIKKMLKEARQEEFNINGYCGTCTDVDINFLLNKMEELEQGSDSDENR